MHEEISQLRQQNAELEEKEERPLLLDTTNTHLFYLADPATYGMANKAHAEFFGFTIADFENTSLHNVLDGREAEVCIEGNKTVFSEKKKFSRKNSAKKQEEKRNSKRWFPTL
ncbi:MAG: hypothetical protein WBB23_03435 [Desulforhopalus sp.]